MIINYLVYYGYALLNGRTLPVIPSHSFIHKFSKSPLNLYSVGKSILHPLLLLLSDRVSPQKPPQNTAEILSLPGRVWHTEKSRFVLILSGGWIMQFKWNVGEISCLRRFLRFIKKSLFLEFLTRKNIYKLNLSTLNRSPNLHKNPWIIDFSENKTADLSWLMYLKEWNKSHSKAAIVT